jgi:hypothetical protein
VISGKNVTLNRVAWFSLFSSGNIVLLTRHTSFTVAAKELKGTGVGRVKLWKKNFDVSFTVDIPRTLYPSRFFSHLMEATVPEQVDWSLLKGNISCDVAIRTTHSSDLSMDVFCRFYEFRLFVCLVSGLPSGRFQTSNQKLALPYIQSQFITT